MKEQPINRLTCRVCGKEFLANRTPFCSKRCRSRDRYERERAALGCEVRHRDAPGAPPRHRKPPPPIVRAPAAPTAQETLVALREGLIASANSPRRAARWTPEHENALRRAQGRPELPLPPRKLINGRRIPQKPGMGPGSNYFVQKGRDKNLTAMTHQELDRYEREHAARAGIRHVQYRGRVVPQDPHGNQLTSTLSGSVGLAHGRHR